MKVTDFMKGHPIITGIIGVTIGVAATKVYYGEAYAVRLIDFLKECTHLKGHLHNGSLLFCGHYVFFVADFINKAEVIDKYIVPELLLEGIVHIVPVAVAAGFLIEDAEDGDLQADSLRVLRVVPLYKIAETPDILRCRYI